MTVESAQPISIFRFGSITEGSASMKNALGGKGANLAEMSSLGIPVPPGFTIPCAASVQFQDGTLDAVSLKIQVQQGLGYLFDTTENMLPLVSVRSGARVSMPGMMDTILNVGLTDSTLGFWQEKIGERVALDSYRRLIQMYASVAMGVPMGHFDAALENLKEDAGVKEDKDLSSENLTRLIATYFEVIAGEGKSFPQTVNAQIDGAIRAVFESWNNPRAIEYRKIHSIPDTWGTAVTVQSMVFGNWDDNSGTGVLFSRNPSTGHSGITGEFLVNAQGEDVVAGIRTPESLDHNFGVRFGAELEKELFDTVFKLEQHYKDMQDIEFTVQQGKLYLLQTRNGKRSAKAAFKIAFDLAKEGLITKQEAASRVTSAQLMALMQDTIDPKFKTAPTLVGIAAGGGLVSGVAMFTSEDAVNCTEPCILVRKETDPDDIAGMYKSLGILTATGGLTSHAAVVARGMNKSCVVGCTDLVVSSMGSSAVVKHLTQATKSQLNKGDRVTIDGSTGKVWFGIKVPVISGGADKEVKELLSWRESGGTATRLSLTTKMGAEDLLELTGIGAGAVYLDTALLQVLQDEQGPAIGNLVAALGGVIADSPAAQVTLDLTGIEDYFNPADEVVNIMFGISPHSVASKSMLYKMQGMQTWPSAARNKVVCKVGPQASKQDLNVLVKMGFSVLSTQKVSTFADLLNANGPVEITPAVIEVVFGSHAAWESAKKMVEASTGKSLSPKGGTPKYWYDMSSTSIGV